MKPSIAPLALASAASAYDSSYSVLTLPATVTAGVGTVIELNLSASSCSVDFPEERGCNWSYFRPWLVADPRYDPSASSDVFIQEYMCYLSPCVSTTLSNFEVTLPPSAVPNGRPYTLAYELFDWRANGTLDEYWPIWSGFESTHFNVTGANGSWTPYDLTGRYSSDNSNRRWYFNVSCATLECARKCANDIVAPKVPFVGGEIPAVDACVEACPEYGWNPRQCITENAVRATSSSSAVKTTSSSTSSLQSNESPTPTAPPASTSTPSNGNLLLPPSLLIVCPFAMALLSRLIA